MISISGIVILGYPLVVPQAKRQEKRNRKFRESKAKSYLTKNYPRLKDEYKMFVASGYPNTREQDRALLTEKYWMDHDAKIAVFNMINGGELKYPLIWLNDVRCAIIGSLLQAIVVLLQMFFPAF